MVKKHVDWEALRRDYEAGEGGYCVLGQRFGISPGRISQVAQAQGWSKRQRANKTAEANTAAVWLQVASRNIAEAAAKAVRQNHEGQLNTRELKELTGVLRELLTLQQTIEGGKDGEKDKSIRVVLEGEVAEWSK